MAIGKQHEELQVRLGTGVLEQVTRFVYLVGLITENGRCEEDVKRRIGLACAAFGGLGKMWREKRISIATKMKLYYTPWYSASLAVRLRMLESEERGRAKAVSGRDELAEENHRKKEKRKSKK